MGKVKQLLTSIEKNKGKMAKFFIACSLLKFVSSTLYRVYSTKDSRTQIETTINIYCLFIVGAIFLHEFLKCFLCRVLTDNMKVMTHYTGKGIIFILISLIYMSHSFGNQQNYSAYLLFFVGIILVVIDCKFDNEYEKTPYELAMERTKVNSQRSINNNLENEPEIVIDVSNNRSDLIQETKIDVTPAKITPASNPYEIPDDF
jgi:uncharacterized protein YacL